MNLKLLFGWYTELTLFSLEQMERIIDGFPKSKFTQAGTNPYPEL